MRNTTQALILGVVLPMCIVMMLMTYYLSIESIMDNIRVIGKVVRQLKLSSISIF